MLTRLARRAASQDGFGFAAHRGACRDSDENGAPAGPASCATGVRPVWSEPPCGAAGKAAARLGSPASTAERPRKAAAAQRKPLTQLHLDLGQVTQHAELAFSARLRDSVLHWQNASSGCREQHGLQSWVQRVTPAACVRAAGQLREHHV